MRSSRSRVGSTIVLGVFVVACTVAPSPTSTFSLLTPGPSVSPSAVVTPTAPPSAIPDTTPSTWTAVGEMTAARVGHTATLLPDGRLLVVGGQDREAARLAGIAPRQLASAELYDPTTGVWTAIDSMAVARFGHTATLLPDGRVLVVGGVDFEAAQVAGVEIMGRTTAELYEPTTGHWIATGSMATGRGAHTATLLPVGKVLVTGGGYADDAAARSAEVYDPKTEQWTAAASMRDGRFGHSATLLRDGRVLVTSGRTLGSDPEALASAELYDPGAGSWTSTGSLAEAHFIHTATLLSNGTVLAVAGDFNRESATSELYDSSSGKWTATGSPALLSLGPTVRLRDGTVLVLGGGEDVDTVRSAELYDPTRERWAITASMANARLGPTLTLLNDGRVLAAGGDFSAVPSAENPGLASAELYGP